MKIALIGRTNVGKSTIFNKLVKRKAAIVNKKPGITRDRNEGTVTLGDAEFIIIDTAGVDFHNKNELSRLMNEQSQLAIKNANIIFFIVDAITGITHEDKEVAEWLRKSLAKHGKRHVLVIANKAENFPQQNFENLGFGEALLVSAEHNIGFEAIYHWVAPLLNDEIKEHKFSAVFIGRPNAGKSTLINTILGEQRLITSNTSGTTRDYIPVELAYKNTFIKLIDTAGKKRLFKQNEFSNSVQPESSIAVLVIDAFIGIEKQDLVIAQKYSEKGFIVILNKWDLVKNKKEALKNAEFIFETSFAQIKGLKIIPVSCVKKININKILSSLFVIHNCLTKQIKTSHLNKWLIKVTEAVPPPLSKGKPINLKYISQVNTNPPAFLISGSRTKKIPEHYIRYLINELRKPFNFNGVPIKIVFN